MKSRILQLLRESEGVVSGSAICARLGTSRVAVWKHIQKLQALLDRFKLFPASVAGGPEALRAFAGPFPGVRVCPTGGIDRAAVQRFLELPNVACVGGSWVATDRTIEAGDWSAIRANAEFVATLRARGPGSAAARV